MTMKNEKTLHRFAAVVAVLLTLCLVFMMPVGATGVEVDTDITQSDFTDGYYHIDVSELTGDTTTFTLKEDVYGKIVIKQTPGNAPIHHITITSEKDVTLTGGIVIRPVNYDIQPITVTVKGMSIYMNASMGVSEGDYDAASGSDVFAVHVPSEVSYGPCIKVNVIDNMITFDSDILEQGKRASILHVHNGQLVHGSQLTGNTASGVTGAAFCFAGASNLNPAPSNNGNYAENPSSIIISNNNVGITPIGSQWAVYGSESALVKIFHNSESVVPYTIKENTVTVETDKSWKIPVLLVKNVQSGKEASIFKSTAISLEDNTITSNYPIYVLEPLSEGIEFKTEHFKSFTVKSRVIVDDNIVGGTISVNPTSFTNGTTVAITAIPDEGYEFDETSLTVTANNGDVISVKNLQFTMPNEAVTVTGSFTKKEEEVKITVTPTSIDLGEVVIGSKDTYKEVTITNNGESTISLEISSDETESKFGVGSDDGWTSIESGKTITLKIYANEELPAGTYSAVMKISCNNNVLSTVAITYTLVEDTTSPDGSVEEIKPEFDETVKTEDGKEVTITIDKETTEVKGNVVTVKDEENGVTMTMTFTSAPTSGEDESTVTGAVAEVKVTYEEKAAEVSTSSEETTGTVEYSMVLDLTKAGITLPTLNPTFDTNKETNIKETPGLSGHTPLAMITATETDDVNADMKANSGNQVAFTFKISKSLLNGKSMKHLVGYHIADDGKVTKIVPNSGDRKEENNYIYVTIYGDKFSTYAVGISDKEEEVITTHVGGGSATDTGSGNYQYYPRSVPTDGIVDFGTSKVVTGMELPAGSDGTVTLNIKPTFAMPENGFYAFEIDTPGYNLDAKINGGLSFQIPVADLEAAGWTAEDIVLFHGTVAEDGKIVWEALPTNLVKVENGVAYYKAAIAGCSPFYIGFVKDGSVVNTEVVDPVTPETPDEPEVLPPVDEPETPEQPESPAPILAVLAGLGAAAVLRRK